MTTYSSQLHEEQRAVTRAYDRLDSLRDQAKERLAAVRAAGSHGSPTQRTERDSFATMYEDRLMQLRAVEDRLVFGRLDDVHGKRRYIGRIGLSSAEHEPILTDWRAEAARPFYEATPSHHGDIVMRRHITLHFREVTGIEDEVLDVHSDQVGKAQDAGTLTGEGALLASLNSKRTGKMTDIVATIQAEQDRIIRAPLDRVVIVQGGPGTGKTAVALHRAAYLLYTHRRRLQNSGVLVIGPSTGFLHYIDQVLPSLGETDVVSRTIADLCARRLPQNMGIASDQIQVLTPTRKGVVGTWSLNKLLQAGLNPAHPTKKERQMGEFSFREGDRVMQIRNNYDIMWKKCDGSAVGSGIFNGDVGIVKSIEPGLEQMTVVFDDREVDYDFDMLGELEPAFAMTVHKSQGSEYRCVVLSAWNGSQYLLNRSVLYTAITRARELLIVVGREETVGIMVQNAKVGRRYTGLKLRLQGRGQ